MLQVIYTCGTCLVKDRKVTIRHRKENEDVRDWMDDVVMTIARDHSRTSRHCHSRKMELVKIPYEKSGLGYVPVEIEKEGAD